MKAFNLIGVTFIVGALLACSQTRSRNVSKPAAPPPNLPTETVFKQNLIPTQPLAMATAYLRAHPREFTNKNYLSVIDYSQPSSAKRFYVLNLKTQQVETFLVAHGRGSDPAHRGVCTSFSDQPRSLKTSLGIFKTAGTYSGGHGLSLKLIGLSATNRNAEARAIVIHGAPYVADGRSVLGRSWGCPAVAAGVIVPLIDKIKEGSLLLAWHPSLHLR